MIVSAVELIIIEPFDVHSVTQKGKTLKESGIK